MKLIILIVFYIIYLIQCNLQYIYRHVLQDWKLYLETVWRMEIYWLAPLSSILLIPQHSTKVNHPYHSVY